jgi:glyoxylate reductase
MEKPLIILTHPLPDEWMLPYQNTYRFAIGPAHLAGLSDTLHGDFSQAQAILSLLCDQLHEGHLRKIPNLRVIANLAAGTDNIDLKYCHDKNILVGNTPGVLTEATADLAMALLLAVNRQIVTSARDARNGRWLMWEPAGWLGMDLHGKTLGIYGMGKIGIAFARRAKAFGMRIQYHNRKTNPDADRELSASCVSFDELLETSDVISVNAPLNVESRKRFDQAAFERMSRSPIFINVGRGQIVDTDALVEALRAGYIRGAGLDVTDPEPLPADHPLFSMEQCLILPHIGSATEETRRKMVDMAMENISAGLAGKPLPYPVE